MSDWFYLVQNEVTALVQATWTDVSAVGVMTQQDSLTKNIVSQFTKKLNNSDSTAIGAPWAIIGMGKAEPDTETLVAANGYRIPVRIWYLTDGAVESSDPDTTPTIQQFCAFKVNQLLAAFKSTTFTTFQVFGDDYGQVDSSVDVGFEDEAINVYCAALAFEKGLFSVVA